MEYYLSLVFCIHLLTHRVLFIAVTLSESLRSRQKVMALDDSQIAKQNFEAAKNFVKRGSLTADEKAILESFPPEVFSQTDPSVEKQTDKIKGL